MGGAQGIAAGVALLYEVACPARDHLSPQVGLATWASAIYRVRYAVSGMKVYDARLVASIKAYGITHLLTFNADDFRRYQDITGIEPQQVLLS
jgi:hypothetical protein